MAEARPSPFELWQQADGNAEEYRRLMRHHGHLVPGKPEPLPCGWPGRRADDEDSRAGATPVAGLGDEGVLLELARGRPATEAEPSAGVRGTAPGGGSDPSRPGQSPCCRVGQAGDAGPPSIPLGGGPAQAPVPDAEGLGATGTGSGPAGSARTDAALPAAGRGMRREKILRVLAGHTGPLPTPEVVDLAGEGIPLRQKALSRYGEALRGLEAFGFAARAGTTGGGYRQPPSVLWIITDAGRERLSQDEAAARHAEAKRRQAVEAAAKLAAAAAVYDRSTPRAVRAEVARELRDAGCFHAQIGAVFGVTGEAIRRDLRLVPRS